MKYNLKIRIALLALAAGLSWPAMTSAQTTNGAEPLALDQVLAEVLTNNPSLKAANARWAAMKERVPQERAWEDPQASFSQRAARFVSVPQNSFPDQQVMVQQRLPLSGQNRRRGDAATAEAASSYEEWRRQQLDLVARARTAYYTLANAVKQLELNRRNSALLKQFSDISRAKLASGGNSQADVLSADTELARLDEAQYDFERDIAEAKSDLNVLMNRLADAPLGLPSDLSFQPVALNLPDLEALALQQRPEMAMALRKVEAAEARLQAARRSSVPEPSVSVQGLRYNDAGQAISEIDAGISIDLPWFNRGKYRAAVRENQDLVEEAQHELAATRAATLGQVVSQFHQLETYHHHTELYQAKLVPMARDNANAHLSGYEANQAGFLEILSAQQTAREIESGYWDHLMHYLISLAQLESTIGADPAAAASNTNLGHHHN